MTHTISFRRPELYYVLSKMTVPPGADVVAHIHRLEDLGYTIVEVAPPLGLPHNTLPSTTQPLSECVEPTSLW